MKPDLRVLYLGLTVGLSILVISALVLVLYGGQLAAYFGVHYGFGEVFVITWKVAQWPISLAFMLLAFALIYYLAPDLHEQKWVWVTPGSVTGVVLWLLVSFGFKLYLHFFDSYSKTYGTLGAVIVLMLWLYFTARRSSSAARSILRSKTRRPLTVIFTLKRRGRRHPAK